MDVVVRLAGATCSWRFAGSARVSAWCDERPWATSGSVLVVVVTGALQRVAIEEVVDGWVRRADGGGTEVRTVAVDIGAGQELARVVGEHFEIPLAVTGRDAVNAIATSLAHSPTVFLANVVAGDAVRVASEALALRDASAKLQPGAALAMLVLTTEPRDDAADLRVGAPIEAVHEVPLGGRHASWRRYLHRRVAWEVAGHYEFARRWNDDFGFESLIVGDDRGVERAFNAAASARLGVVPPAAVARALDSGATGRIADLEADGLIWRPRSRAYLRPTPWFARAVLLSGMSPTRWRMLRGCVVAAPLVQEAMGRCLDLECKVRDLYHEKVGVPTGLEESERAYLEFGAGRHFYQQFYPAECPARPRDQWDFTGLGSVLQHISVPARAMDTLHRLRRLRNALAHGHYVCWRTFELLEELEAAI
jgi:hypothetical protein